MEYWANATSNHLETFQAKLLDKFHAWRKKNGFEEKIEVPINGVIFGDLIAEAKKEIYAENPELKAIIIKGENETTLSSEPDDDIQEFFENTSLFFEGKDEKTLVKFFFSLCVEKGVEVEKFFQREEIDKLLYGFLDEIENTPEK